MYLMGHQQMFILDSQQIAQQGTILTDRFLAIATIVVDIKRSIVAFAKATMPCAAEGSHASTKMIEM
jgi:hypothetical protein